VVFISELSWVFLVPITEDKPNSPFRVAGGPLRSRIDLLKAERNHQIRMIKQIFFKADLAVVWLGLPLSSSGFCY
jgi:hypothetical protein